MSKLGLVFSGGGGKGAYEIGVWKAFKEFGTDKGVVAVAGTSVGGLNGALFIQGDYAAGETLWKSITPDKILKIDLTDIAVKAAKMAAKLSIPSAALIDMATALKGRGWFTQEGLRQLIQASGVCSAVKASDIPFHVCALNGNTGKLELPKLNALPVEEIEKWLLASAAIPLIFEPIEINGQRYHDGGVVPGLSNNTPYQPLIEKYGCTHIISILLDNAPIMRKEQMRYAATNFWNIVPTLEFKGGISAPLNFTAENACELIERGYADTKNILMQFKEFQRSEDKTQGFARVIEYASKQADAQIKINENIRNDYSANPDSYHQLLDQLRAEIDRRELDLIDTRLDDFLERYADNSQMMQEAMFEGIATLASTEGRIKHAMKRGAMARIWEGVTGKGCQATAEIQWDLNRATYFNQILIQKLSERNSLTLEAVSSLGSRLTYVMSHTNYLTAASDFHQKAIKVLAEVVSQLQLKLDSRLRAMDERIEATEKRTDLQMWLLGLPHEMGQFSVPHLVLRTAKKFYEFSDGNWRSDEYLALQGQVILCAKEKTCSLQSLAEVVKSFPPQLSTDRFPALIADSAVTHPAYSAMHPASAQFLPSLEARGISCTAEISALQLITEILCSMRLRDLRKNQLNSYTECIGQLKMICQQTGLQEYQDPLQRWQQKMQDYRVLAPLVGKFSAGKSTLLNALMGRELLGVDIDPETADASELHYNAQEYAEGIYLDGQQQPCSHVMAMLASADANPLWYYRRHIDNPLLRDLGKLILVDMPGLDSTKLNHEKAIANYIERSEVFLGVMSSEVVFDDSVMRVLKEAHDKGKEIHLVITKCGRQSDAKLQELRQSLQDFFAGADPMPEISLIESRDGHPGTTEFLSLIYRLSSRYNEFFKGRFEPTLQNFAQQIRTKLEGEQKLSNSGEVEIKQKMAAEQKVYARLHETIRSEQAALKKNLLGAGVEQVVARVLTALQNERGRLVTAIESNTLAQTISSVVRPVAQAESSSVVANAIAEFTKRIENVIETSGAGVEINIAVISPEMKEGDSGKLEAGIGAAVGLVILGPVGALIGGIVGWIFGNNEKEARDENLRLFDAQVVPAILSSVAQQLSLSFSEYADKVAEKTQKFIDQQREALEVRRSQMLEDLQTKKQEFEARRQILTQAIHSIDNHVLISSSLPKETPRG